MGLATKRMDGSMSSSRKARKKTEGTFLELVKEAIEGLKREVAEMKALMLNNTSLFPVGDWHPVPICSTSDWNSGHYPYSEVYHNSSEDCSGDVVDIVLSYMNAGAPEFVPNHSVEPEGMPELTECTYSK